MLINEFLLIMTNLSFKTVYIVLKTNDDSDDAYEINLYSYKLVSF